MNVRERLDWGPLATPAPDRLLPVYNWFRYRESFSRGLVMRILDMLGAGEGLVIDPFCGVGTTMLACRERGIDSVGFDSHPLAVFVSRVKLREYPMEDLLREMDRVLKAGYVKPKLAVRDRFISRAFPRGGLEEIVFYRDLIMQARNKDVMDFLLLGLMTVALRCSYIRKDGAAVKIRKVSVPLPRRILRGHLERMVRELDGIRKGSCRTRADFGDARRLGLADRIADFIITSPPYLNKREYETVSRIEQELFLDMIGFRPHSPYIGSVGELGEDSAKLIDALGTDAVKGLPKAAKAYFVDMLQAIEEMYRVCRFGGRVAMVVGNGCFPAGVVESDVILSRIAEHAGFRPGQVLVLNKRWCMRNRTRKVGVLRESLLVWEK
jgi:DNA modification methylase